MGSLCWDLVFYCCGCLPRTSRQCSGHWKRESHQNEPIFGQPPDAGRLGPEIALKTNKPKLQRNYNETNRTQDVPKNIPISHEPQAPTCLGLSILTYREAHLHELGHGPRPGYTIVFLWRCCRQRWSSRVNPEQALRLESRVPLFTPRAWAVDNRRAVCNAVRHTEQCTACE